MVVKPNPPRKSRLLLIVLSYIVGLFVLSLVISISSMNSGVIKPSQVCVYARKFLTDDSLSSLGKTIDCSKYTQIVYKKFKIEIPRSSAQQFSTFAVDKNKLRAGDLVFFSTESKKVGHVGIYLGNNHFIHSPGNGENVKIDDLKDEYWNEHYVGSGCVIGHKEDNED
jgi:hypothetical protein